MMKIVALFMTVAVAVTASIEMPMEIQADSELGMRLLSEARELEGSEWTHTWVAGYSLKFEGCHHISQWNPEAVRFLCRAFYLVMYHCCILARHSHRNLSHCFRFR
jgi:hypothetical protein